MMNVLRTIFLLSLLPRFLQTIDVYVSRQTPASSKTKCGSSVSDPCPTIKSAIDIAKNNHRIVIMASDDSTTSYDECPISVTKPLYFTGMKRNSGYPVIDCGKNTKSNGFVVKFKESKKLKTKSVDVLTVDISNLTIRNAETAVLFTMPHNNKTNIRIWNVTFERNNVDVDMKGSPLCFLQMKGVVLRGGSGDGVRIDSCKNATVSLTDTNFLGKYIKVVSTKDVLTFTAKAVTVDMNSRSTSAKDHQRAPVHIEASKNRTSVNFALSAFFNHKGKTKGIVTIECPKISAKKNAEVLNETLKSSVVVIFNNVTFWNNSVTADKANGSAFRFHASVNRNESKPPSVIFNNCTFRENSASLFGGAIWLDKSRPKTVRFESCEFVGNRAQGPNGTGRGGALYAMDGKLLLNKCTFRDNVASSAGGGLYAEGENSIIISNTTFQNRRHPRTGVKGDAVYVRQKPTYFIGNVIFDSQSANFQKAIFWFQGNPKVLIMGNLTRFVCPPGYNYAESEGVVGLRLRGYYHVFGFKCVPCQDLFYSVSRGYWQLISGEFRGKCRKCPYGASCNGTIRARPNFWGTVKGDEVEMIACPRGYCCNSEPCDSYDSCASHRTGTLCGHCERGFSEGLSSPACRPNKNCSSSWHWIFLLFDVALIFFLCLFHQEITVKASDLLQSCLERNQRALGPGSNNRGDDDDDDDEEERYVRNDIASPGNLSIRLRSTTRNLGPGYEGMEESSSFNNTRGYVKVFFYFYQVKILLHVSSSSSSSSFSDWFIRFLTPFLNFQFTEVFSDCLVKDMSPVSKTFFKNTLCFWVLCLALVSYGFYLLLRKLRTECYYSQPLDQEPGFICMSFPVRLIGAVMQITLLSYVALTLLTAQLLNCVEVNGRRVLYIDGSVQCYHSPAQDFIWCFLVLYVICFPFVLIFGRMLLISGHVSPARFVVACFLPLLFLLYWLYLYVKDNFGRNAWQSRSSGRNLYRDKILYILQHPYREAESRDSPTLTARLAENWESVLIFRRLVLVLTVTFVKSALTRAYLTFALCLGILALHVFVHPFVNKWVNKVETASLGLLTLFTGFAIGQAAASTVGKISPPQVATAQSVQDWFIVIATFLLLMVAVGSICCYAFRYVYENYRSRRYSNMPNGAELEIS